MIIGSFGLKFLNSHCPFHLFLHSFYYVSCLRDWLNQWFMFTSLQCCENITEQSNFRVLFWLMAWGCSHHKGNISWRDGAARHDGEGMGAGGKWSKPLCCIAGEENLIPQLLYFSSVQDPSPKNKAVQVQISPLSNTSLEADTLRDVLRHDFKSSWQWYFTINISIPF